MKILQSLIILIVILVLSTSCDKQEEITGGNHHYLMSESLNSMLFQKDSYWIYKNPISDLTETITLNEIKMDTIGPFNTGHGYTSTNQVYNLNYSSTISGEYQEQYVGYVISRGSTMGGYIYLSSHQIGDSTMNAKINNIHDTLNINEITYKDVIEMDIKEDSFIEHNMNLYYVDSIGLVKKEIKEENIIQETWELIEYDINFLDIQ